MPEFAYIALDNTGKRSMGTLAGGSRAAVIDQLSQRGLHPIEVHEAGNGQANRRSLFSRSSSSNGQAASDRVPAKAVEAFTRELANLLAGGVSLARALDILTREASNPAAGAQWEKVNEEVSAGSTLAEAMGRFPKSFPPVYLAMIRAGETGGFLDVVLTQIADFREREKELLGKVKTAMIYPCILVCMMIGVIIFCMTYFIPKFSDLFKQFGEQLPALTRVVVALSNGFWTYGPLVLIAVIVGVIYMRQSLTTDIGRRRFEKVMLQLPMVGRVTARFALVRFTRMLGTLLGAGVPLVASLKVAREAIGIQTLSDAVDRATEDVQRGEALARSLATADRLFPGSVIEMVSVAEETGKLDTELMRIATTYEKELDRELGIVVALAEPLILVVMAAIVGTFIVSMMLPIFTMQDMIR